MLAPFCCLAAVARVQTGAEMMQRNGFASLEGHRVGLVTNHTAVVGNQHLIDALFDNPKIKLVALFGPEHGLRGEADAGAKVGDSIDARTGVPVYSLYGSNRQPTPKQLEGCDILVYDIQDIGARFYTYISTLGLCMQSAAKAHIPFLILDRPNPLGGQQVSGYIREDKYESFVGQYPVPIQYGLTAGELAQMIQGEKWVPGLEALDLRIEKVKGWRRGDLFPRTGLSWVAPSPNIPDFETALVYPGSCLFEAVYASEGRGTEKPFLTLGAPYLDSAEAAKRLNAAHLPGVVVSAMPFTPRSIKGMSESPRFQDRPLHGIQISVTDPAAVRPVELGIHLVTEFFRQTKGLDRVRFFNSSWMAKLAGTSRLEADLSVGKSPEHIIASWQFEVEQFRQKREPYLLYKP